MKRFTEVKLLRIAKAILVLGVTFCILLVIGIEHLGLNPGIFERVIITFIAVAFLIGFVVVLTMLAFEKYRS